MDRVLKKDRDFLENVFECYSKKDLLAIGKKYGLKGLSSCTRQEAGKRLIECLLSRETAETFLKGMSENEIQLFLDIRDQGLDDIQVDYDEVPLFWYFLDNGYAVLRSNGCCIRMLGCLYSYYDGMDEKHFWEEREKNTMIFQYARVANLLYGITPIDQILSIYNHYQKKKLTRDELLRVLKIYAPLRSEFELYKGQLVDERLFYPAGERTERMERLLETQGDKPFYFPTMAVINELTIQENYVKQACEERLEYFLEKQSDRYEEILYDMKFSIMYGASLKQIVINLDQIYGIRFGSEREAEEFCRLFMDLWNHTRMIGNRGFTPLEMAEKMHQKIPDEAKEKKQTTKSQSGGAKVIDFSKEREKRRRR